MPATLNRQPIFTAAPITVSLGLDLELNTADTYQTNSVTPIYTDATSYGSLITKITVRANPNITSARVSTKRIDLYISDDADGGLYNLYSSQLMTGADPVGETTPVPSVIFEFPNGLVLQSGKSLGLSTTMDSKTSGYLGDFVSIVVEGGTYDDPSV